MARKTTRPRPKPSTLLEQLRAPAGPKVKPVELPTGVTGYVRLLSPTERLAIIATGQQDNETAEREELLTRVLLHCLCDQDGKRRLGDREAAELENLDPKAVELLLLAALDLNGLTEG